MNENRWFLHTLATLAILTILLAVWRQMYLSRQFAPQNANQNPPISRDIDLHADESFYSPEIDNKASTSTANAVKPEISAKSYLIGNVKTGDIIAEHNSELVLPIASMSKLMTAYVASQMMSPTTTIEIGEDDLEVFADKSNLQKGEKFTFNEILEPLLLSSSNVAAEAIASQSQRASFVESMSAYSWEIGLPSTYFSDPSGLSPNNRASVRGFFELARYIFNNERELYDVTLNKVLKMATTTEHGSHTFINTHPFVGDKRFVGGKTGRTPEAGDTMLTILEINGDYYAFIILGSEYDKRKQDTDKLVEKYMNRIMSYSEVKNSDNKDGSLIF